MDENEMNSRISRIDTLWTVVRGAHQGPTDKTAESLEILIRRYQKAIYRYLLAALRNADAADEVFQEFALRLVQGRFRSADPERGRFRDLVRTSLSHLIVDYHRRQRGRLQELPSESALPGYADDQGERLDQEYIAQWREELLQHTWDALAQSAGGGPYYSVLRFRATHPNASMTEMAQSLTAELGRPLTEVSVRQMLHRARKKFAELLLAEVERGLLGNDPQGLRDELEELGLLPYCQTIFDQRQ